MKKLLLISIAVFLANSFVFAQTRSRVFDNFDTSGGVRIVTPTVKPIVETKKTPEKKTVNSNNTTMSVTDGYALSDNKVVKTSYSRLTMSVGNSMGNFTTGDDEIDGYIVDSSKRYGIDPLLIYAQMHQESSFKKRATSYKGASGLMQLMPATARRFGVRALQKYVEDELSEALIQGEIDDESLIEIFLDKEKLAFRSITNGKIKKQKIS